MKLFSCVCGQIVFFESVTCTRCGRALAFLPDRQIVGAVEDVGEGLLQDALLGAKGPRYRACRNGREYGVCNWAVVAEDSYEYCRACRLNQVIPNLSDSAAREVWHRLEIAKRRLLCTLLDLGLPVASKREDPERGLAFAFLKEDATAKVYTGHSDGLVTINVAEADDPSRERMRVQMGEPYRTLLGHFRHESGHYYWDRLIGQGDDATRAEFRERFGDESADYAQARDGHYRNGAPLDWPNRFVSAYASMHPWEDWAETWAHYLHVTDTLETARAYDLVLKPKPEAGVARTPTLSTRRLDPRSFEDLMTGWVPLAVALNSLNRSMGLADPYPFVLPPPAVEKLRFVHQVIGRDHSAAMTSTRTDSS
jgi:hypothetical protein